MLNVLLTFVELVAGIIAGSLALIGDAVHNGSDVGALIIALIARRWSRREPDSRRTYGYRRASIIGAMVNVTTLIIIGIYLLYESAMRIIDPVTIDGWIMIIVASIALMVDLGTVLLMRLMGKDLNIRAALAHNLADAMASVGVIVAGATILTLNFIWVDPILTGIIAIYILIQSVTMLRPCIAILMDSCPNNCDPKDVSEALKTISGVEDVRHMHIRSLDEDYIICEACIVVSHSNPHSLNELKNEVKNLLLKNYEIKYTTLELDFKSPESLPLNISENEGR